MVQNADVPYKALLGPWNHTFPHIADPEPAIEWREMAVRWLDHWLKGKDTGILKKSHRFITTNETGTSQDRISRIFLFFDHLAISL